MLWPARKSLCMTKNSAVPSACAACLQAPPCTWGVARKLLPELNPAVLPTSRGPIGTNSSGAITVDRPSHLFTRPFFGRCFGSNSPYPWILAVEFTMFQSVEKNRLFSHILFDVDDTFRFRRLAPHVSLRRLAISTERPLTSWPPRNARWPAASLAESAAPKGRTFCWSRQRTRPTPAWRGYRCQVPSVITGGYWSYWEKMQFKKHWEFVCFCQCCTYIYIYIYIYIHIYI